MTDPILIVGAGPTGLTAALELLRLDIPVRLIDRLTEPSTTSRAAGIQARTLELMQQRGLAGEMVRLGNPASGASIYSAGKQLTRLDLSRVDSRFNYLLFLSQAETERILRDAVSRLGVAVERGVEMVALSQDAMSHGSSPVRAVLRHPDGRLEIATAPWLIGAEGAHSVVRTTLDLRFEGKTLDDAYALGDLRVAGDLSEGDVHIFSSESGFMGLFPMGAERFRLIASNPLSKPHQDTEPSLDELQRIYDGRSHIPARFGDLSWSSWFHINSRMVPRLRAGRLLLGGDAAHIHSPAGGQGMNTGIQDMINLAWKLALVVRGDAPDRLLDTYEADRLPVMREVLFQTENLTALMGSESPVVRSLINHIAPWIGGIDLVQDTGGAQMSQVALGYRGSTLSSNYAHAGTLRAGDRVPDLAVRLRGPAGWTPADLQDVLDPSRFTLLVASGSASGSLDPALQDAAKACGELVKTVELAPPETRAGQAEYETELGGRSGVFLVRPDGYVGLAAGAHGATRQLSHYWRHWFAGRNTQHAA